MRVARPLALTAVLLPLLLWVKLHPSQKLVSSTQVEGRVVAVGEKTLESALPGGRRTKIWKLARALNPGDALLLKLERYQDGSIVAYAVAQSER